MSSIFSHFANSLIILLSWDNKTRFPQLAKYLSLYLKITASKKIIASTVVLGELKLQSKDLVYFIRWKGLRLISTGGFVLEAPGEFNQVCTSLWRGRSKLNMNKPEQELGLTELHFIRRFYSLRLLQGSADSYLISGVQVVSKWHITSAYLCSYDSRSAPSHVHVTNH